MSNYKDENKLILDTVRWCNDASKEINKAGGASGYLLGQFPDDLLVTLVRNKIGFKYYGPAR